MQATMGRRPAMRRKGDSKRSMVRVVLRGAAGVGLLLLFVFKEVLITHGLFLRTFFRSSVSATPPPIKLDIGYWNKLQFKTILILRYLAKDQFAYQRWMKRVHDRILHRLEATGAPVREGALAAQQLDSNALGPLFEESADVQRELRSRIEGAPG